MRQFYLIVSLLFLGFAASAQCTGPLSVTITGSGTGAPLDGDGIVVQPSCNDASGALDGSIDITITGGTLPYTYTWTQGATFFSNDEDLTQLGTGIYTVTVTDAATNPDASSAGCEVVLTFEITEPTPVELTGTPVEPLCHEESGSLTGSISLSVTGGTGAYTYNWETTDGDAVVQTAQDQTGLGGGTYCVTVSDANNCTDTECWTLTEPDEVVLTEVHTDLTCHPDDYLNEGPVDGSITLTVSGGTIANDYTYTWSPVSGGIVQGQQNQTGLAAGTYTVIVSDDNGCQETVTVEITQPDPIVISETLNQLACNAASGNPDGSIDITVVGGTPTYTFSWTSTPGGLVPSGQASNQNLNTLPAGDYTVLVTDDSGCTQTATYTLNEPVAVAVNGTPTDLLCHENSGSPTGIINTAPTGGTGTYTYVWTPATGGIVQGQQNQTGLEAGTYTVVVSDVNNCTAEETFTLNQPTEVELTGVTDEPDCNTASGALDGSITVSVTGGTPTATAPGYAFNWAGPGVVASAQNQTGLGTGSYSVTVTDANGCTDVEAFTLTEPTPVTATGVVDEPDCNVASGTLDGSIDLSPSGGTPGAAPNEYAYAWSTVDGTLPANQANVQDPTGLGTGTYTVVVTDPNGCSFTTSFTLTEPTAVEVTAQLTNLSCNDLSGSADGEIDITATGGTSPYTFAWTTSNGSIPVGQEDDEDQTGLSAGTYTVVVTDDNGCTAIDSWELTEPTAVEINGTFTDLNCHINSGAADGTITTAPTGGTGTYTYTWTPTTGGITQGSQNQTGLEEGTYTVTVADVNGCSAEQTFTLTQPTEVEATEVHTDLSCNSASGSPDGTITVSVTGGTEAGAYDYNWSGPTGASLTANAASQTGLVAGTYDVTITDDNSCTDVISITLTEPTPVTATGTPDQPDCNTASGDLDGAIDLSPSGGTPGAAPNEYTYLWTTVDGSIPSGQETVQDPSGLGTGTYTVVVTDANNCTFTTSFTLLEPTPVDVVGVTTDLDCNSNNGSSNGGIVVTPSGGTPGAAPNEYTYSWTASAGGDVTGQATNQNLTNVPAGTYTVVVTDANGCTGSNEWTLTQPDPIVITATPTDPPCNAANTPQVMGEIALSVSGGTGTYTYAWSTSDGGAGLIPADQSQTQLSGGTYTVVVTDGNSCTAETTVVLTEPDEINVLAQATNLSCHADNGAANGTITLLQVVGGTVAADYQYTWTQSNGGSGVVDGQRDQTGLTAGTYDLVITDDNGCTFSATYVLTQPDPIQIDESLVQLTCNSANANGDGAINLTVTQGTSPYTFAWTSSNGGVIPTGDESLQNLDNLTAGTYTVVVTDANGCTETETYDLNEPTPVTCSIAEPPVNSCGDHIDCNGNTVDVTVTAAGGSGNYTYSIDGGANWQGSNVFTVGAGVHTITTQDDQGCETTCEVTITEPDPLVAGTCVPEQDECQVSDGEIQVQADGGCPPYTVTWTSPSGGSLDQASQQITTAGGTVLFTGATGGEDYIFTVTDANGCVIGG